MYKFTSLEILHDDMKKKSEESMIFNFIYNKQMFSCIFLTNILPMLLYLCTVGENPLVFEISIDHNYQADTYLEDYKKLIRYLNIKYDPKHKFRPIDFFDALNMNIPHKFNLSPNYKDILMTVAKKRNIEEENKIYFCGWKNNAKGYKVSEKNLEKTKFAFGEKLAAVSKATNKSSCWSANSNEEDLSKLNSLTSL